MSKVYYYNPAEDSRWTVLAKGTYFTSCLTQTVFLSSQNLFTAGTDGHAVVWPLSPELYQPGLNTSGSISTLEWHHPTRIHQNASKTLATFGMTQDRRLIVSGGDDGSLAFILASTKSTHPLPSKGTIYESSPVVVGRTHGSAVTACVVLEHKSGIFVLTSGNDEWIRLWEVICTPPRLEGGEDTLHMQEDLLSIRRHQKMKTNVADVSSMAVVDSGSTGTDARILLCGVGMEIMRLAWGD